ncbi:GIY-YIG nuclease family protein [Vibrio sp. Sgm 22]|uniref:GIY-YIG nuclease family protein n=1 Tax=unclassified Vibrio TaxID=2614977 RepID=UPI00224921CD|nr:MULTISPECIES: GIY-YIG nuclease family protein [unclassified Vibrio]MCX2760053.1 GIY-YIG nuclease family protein [Vibrio sp. 14G-20]MCX2777041.1 GIY-YIG nuclease family protein [Vibrio sp. Sgm 22]
MAIEYKGKTYDSIGELLNEHHSDVSLPTVKKRIKAGWSVEDALNKPRTARITKEKFKFRGNEYGSLSGLHTANKEIITVSFPTFKQRVDAGWSIEKAATEPKGVAVNGEVYKYKGKTYGTIRALYLGNKKDANCSFPTFQTRIKEEKLSVEEAFTAEKHKTGAPKYGPHTIEGVVYELLSDVAKEYGVNENTMYQRYNRGARNDDLVLKRERKDYVKPEKKKRPKKIPDHARAVEYNGITYPSITAMIEEFGVKHCTYNSRIKRGLTIGQALGVEKVVDGRSLVGTTYEYKGETLTAKQLADKYGMSESTIRDRLFRGATIEMAMRKEKIQKGVLDKQREAYTNVRRPAVTLEVGGVEYHGYRALANAYGLKDYVVRQRIVDYGWTPEEAVSKTGKSVSITVDGVKYERLIDAAEKFGVRDGLISSRLADGWTPEEAVGLVLHESLKSVQYKGKWYKSIKELAEEVGINERRLVSRLRSGLTAEEAVNRGSEKIKSSGRYNLTILERDPELAAKPCVVYFVSMLINDDIKYKIGITTLSVQERFSSEKILYEEVAVANSTLIECYKLEQQIHELLDKENEKDIDGSVLAGYTEIFNLDDDEVSVIVDLMQSWQEKQ